MRKSVVLESENEFWSKLSIDYMTEESDHEADPGNIVIRHIPWRSKCNYFLLLC